VGGESQNLPLANDLDFHFEAHLFLVQILRSTKWTFLPLTGGSLRMKGGIPLEGW